MSHDAGPGSYSSKTLRKGCRFQCGLDAERRDRYDHKVYDRRCYGFPKLEHVDTELIDKVPFYRANTNSQIIFAACVCVQLQMPVQRNHNFHLFPTWSSIADHATTTERFGIVLRSRFRQRRNVFLAHQATTSKLSYLLKKCR